MNDAPLESVKPLRISDPGIFGLLLGILALTTLVFARVVSFEFLNLDDETFISQNPFVQQGLTNDSVRWAFGADLLFESSNADYWQPVTFLSRMVDVELFGMNPGWHHLTNLLIHLTTVSLLFYWLFKFTNQPIHSAVITLIFAIHPVQVEPVAWVTQRKDMLFGFFTMLTLIAYSVHTRRGDKHWMYYMLALFFMALGIMSKPMIMILPAIMILIDFWPLKRIEANLLMKSPSKAFRTLFLDKIPFFALSALSFQATSTNHNKPYHDFWDIHLLVPGKTVWYALQSLFPGEMCFRMPSTQVVESWPGYLVSLVVVVVVGWLFGRQIVTRPWMFVGWFWFFIGLFPTHPSMALAERHLYFPLIGLSIISVYGFAELTRWARIPRPVTITFCLVLAGVLAAGSSIQLPVWRDSISLNRHALKCDSNNAQAHNNLARALAGSGRLEEAIPFFARYAELLPYAAKAHYQLGLAYQNHGDISGAIREYRICIRLDGGYVQGLNNLAWIRATAQDWTLRNPEEAIALASRALELSKTPTPAILDTLSAACARAGLYEDAIRHGSAAADLALRGGNLELGRQILERVKLYRAGQTYEE
jgi:protein O-mannosyl-transferase